MREPYAENNLAANARMGTSGRRIEATKRRAVVAR